VFLLHKGIHKRDIPKTLIHHRDILHREAIHHRDTPNKDILLLQPTPLSTNNLRLDNRVATLAAWKAVWLLCAVAVSWMPAFDERY
jgi:hypothetical protein